jgi:hypothetical protein
MEKNNSYRVPPDDTAGGEGASSKLQSPHLTKVQNVEVWRENCLIESHEIDIQGKKLGT